MSLIKALKQASGPPAISFTEGREGNILMLSMRQIANLVAYCLQYEFEDVITSTAAPDTLEPTGTSLVEFQRRAYKVLHKATQGSPVALRLTPQLGGIRLEKTYDLFLPIFNHPYEVFALAAVPGWRKHCRYAACIISEAWEDALPEYLLETLAEFDKIYLCSNPVDSVARITGRPCEYLSLGIDAVGFCPFPAHPARCIDVLGIGRRSQQTHAALLDLAKRGDFFYYYDTVKTTVGVADAARQVTFGVIDPTEHRLKLGNMLKRSRYYLASRARANQSEVAEEDEMSGRFFEGAAAGAIMLGEAPRSGRYHTLFDWPDAVVDMPFDAPHIADVMKELEAQPDRCIRIRRDNMLGALSRHDYAHRLRTILEDARMEAPPGLLAREARLRELADMVKDAQIAP